MTSPLHLGAMIPKIDLDPRQDKKKISGNKKADELTTAGDSKSWSL